MGEAGYQPQFLDAAIVAAPLLTARARAQAWRDGEPIEYTHFTIVMNQARRLATFTACNIDGAHLLRMSRPRGAWAIDARLPARVQLGDEFYRRGGWDRGHLVRRRDVVWGEREKAARANRDTFHFTNAAPQHHNFNGDEWLHLEDWVLERAGSNDERLCVFTGPVFTQDDPLAGDVLVPAAFWKVVVGMARDAGSPRLSATGFLMKQVEMWDDAHGAEFLNLATHQLTLQKLEELTFLDFGAIKDADELKDVPAREFRSADGRRVRLWPRVSSQRDIYMGADGFGGLDRIAAVRDRVVVPMSDDTGGRRGRGLDRQLGQALEEIERREGAAGEGDRRERGFGDGDAWSSGAMAAARRAAGESSDLRERVIGGQLVQPRRWRSCVCVGGSAGGHFRWLCSGVLIAPRAVLTVAHSVGFAWTPDRVLVDALEVSEALRSDDKVARVIECVPHPDYHELRTPSHDLCLLRLKEAPRGVAPARWDDERTPARGDQVVLVGFGAVDEEGLYGAGTKREARVAVEAVSGEEGGADVTKRLDFAPGFEFVAGRKGFGVDTCAGDSGGPVYLVGGADAAETVVGLTLRAVRGHGSPCGSGGVYLRVGNTKYREWIRAVLASWESAST